MSEYIEKSALLKAIEAVKPDITMNLGAGAYMTPYEAARDMYNDIKDVIEGATAADAAPVIHGHWEHKGWFDNECSICHSHYPATYRFCPDCGAKMGESEDSGNV